MFPYELSALASLTEESNLTNALRCRHKQEARVYTPDFGIRIWFPVVLIYLYIPLGL